MLSHKLAMINTDVVGLHSAVLNVYIRFLSKTTAAHVMHDMYKVDLSFFSSSCHHIIQLIHASRLTGYIYIYTAFYTLQLLHELLSDTASEWNSNQQRNTLELRGACLAKWANHPYILSPDLFSLSVSLIHKTKLLGWNYFCLDNFF